MTTQHTSHSVTIGLDLGDRRHHYCALDSNGTILTEAAIPNTRECLAQLSERFAKATFIMETGTHSPWVPRLLESHSHHVIVANARKLRAISTSHSKTDTEDARMLARLGRADPKLLSPVRHRSEATQRALIRLKIRDALVRIRRTALVSLAALDTLHSGFCSRICGPYPGEGHTSCGWVPTSIRIRPASMRAHRERYHRTCKRSFLARPRVEDGSPTAEVAGSREAPRLRYANHMKPNQ